MGMRPIQNLLWSLGLRFPPTKSGSLERGVSGDMWLV
jgi:hypothetical protein